MRESDPVLERLADANPVPDVEVDRTGLSSTAEDVLAQLFTDRPSRSGGPDPRRKRTRRAAAAGVVIASLLGATLILRGGGDAPASASELLLQTAAIAGDRESAIQEGEYLYSKVETDQLITHEGSRGWSAVLPAVEEHWVAGDGSGRVRSTFGEPRFFGSRDQERWEAAGAQEFASGISDKTFLAGALTYEDLSLLPTRPSALDEVLRDNVSSQALPSDVGVFLSAGRLLASGSASPELRAALYRLASQLPGVELIGDTTDPSGRPGVAVAMTYSESGAAVQVLMIFEAETSVLLAQESILLERASWVDAEAGTRLWSTVYLETGWTESIAARPSPSPN